jgi:hypothetical protein
MELSHYLQTIEASPSAWLFPSTRKGIPVRPGNFLKRVLKPAAIEAGVAVTTNEQGKKNTGLNFQSSRRTSSTLFGALAKDPKSTPAHMRHTDPQVTLKHYQQAVPAEVKAAGGSDRNNCARRRQMCAWSEVLGGLWVGTRRKAPSKPLIFWSHPPESNRRPADYESAALPTELGWLRLGENHWGGKKSFLQQNIIRR